MVRQMSSSPKLEFSTEPPCLNSHFFLCASRIRVCSHWKKRIKKVITRRAAMLVPPFEPGSLVIIPHLRYDGPIAKQHVSPPRRSVPLP